jgi:hypothetical protein
MRPLANLSNAKMGSSEAKGVRVVVMQKRFDENFLVRRPQRGMRLPDGD